jgi:hypothetical protein
MDNQQIKAAIDANVPPKLRAFSEWFCEYYGINGTSDPMYVCNVLAVMRGEGDGLSVFHEQDPVEAQEPEAIHKRLLHAYSTCIANSGREPSFILDALIGIDRKPKPLTCCCCGEAARGVHWWNRDTGYGLCPACVPLFRKDGIGYLTRTNGIQGIHFDISE